MATDTTGGYCAKHDRHYSALGDCDDCRDARRGAVAQGSPKADLRELELREGEFRADAKYLRRRAREWIDDGTAQERNIALKAFDTAAKYERLALEIHAKVIEVKHDHWLRDENMKISGGSGN